MYSERPSVVWWKQKCPLTDFIFTPDKGHSIVLPGREGMATGWNIGFLLVRGVWCSDPDCLLAISCLNEELGESKFKARH